MNCFPGLDYNIHSLLSPRHFEAAITKTLQILVEGKYENIFIPGIHYLELKDFSNINNIIELLHDTNYCQKLLISVMKILYYLKIYL